MYPGLQSLGDFAIGAAGTQVGSWVAGLDGLTAVNLLAKFAYGSGGTKTTVYIQTSLDGGATVADIAAITFTTSGASKIVNLSGLTPHTTEVTPTDAALTDDTCVDGVLGDRLRAKVVSTGTYAGNTTLSIRAGVR